MRLLFISGLLAAITCLAQEPFERVLQLARTRQKMAQSLTHLPDFTCLATMQRVVRGHRDREFKALDTIRFEIAHQGHTELWSWPGAAKFQDTPFTSMVKNGTIGDGDFALHAKAVFVDGSANMKFIGPVDLEGRATLQWDFTIPVFASGWKITSSRRSAVVGASGSFWADAENLDVVRLDIRATGLPFRFPVSAAEQSIDYARMQIGSASVLLPKAAALFMEDIDGEKRNITEFSHCRQFSGSAEISFVEAPPAGAVLAEPVKPTAVKTEVTLPARLRVRIKLMSSIDSQSAIVGDPIQATIERDIGERGKMLVPKGALIAGRLRRVEKHGAEFFVVGIEFDDIEFPGHHARFSGSFKSMESDVPAFQWFHKTSTTTEVEDKRITKGQVYRVEEVSGVGTFIMNGARFRLPAGTVMVWETQ